MSELYSNSASSSVIEVDKPISITSITSSTSAGHTTVTVTLHDTDNTYRMSGTLSDFTPTFTWGDGNTTTTGITGSTLGGGDFQFTATHDYSISQPSFSVKVDDVGGATDDEQPDARPSHRRDLQRVAIADNLLRPAACRVR